MPVLSGVRFCARCGTAINFLPPVPATQYPISQPYPHLKGIGGWLVVVAFILALSPIAVIQSMLQTDIPRLEHAGSPGGALLWSIFLLRNIVVFAALLVLNWLFYSERKSFPRAMIAYLLGLIVLGILQCFVDAAFVPDQAVRANFSLALRVLHAAIWIPYYLRSRRVKATFIH
jgi:hypothetical protein